ELLAGAALARDQDGRIRVRHQIDLLQHRLEGRALSNDAADPRPGEARRVPARYGAAHGLAQVVDAVRLGEHVEYARLHGAHGRADVRGSGEEDGRGIHPGSSELLMEVETRNAGKDEVRDEAGRRLGP